MEKRDYYPILESILFTMGKSVEIKTLAEALKLTQEEIKQILQDMAKEYSEKQRGIQLVFLEDSVQLCTKPQYYEYLIRIASRPQKQVLSDSVLETLSIVAYKQPVTRGEIERIRGVKSDHAIAKLMDYDLIEEIEDLMRCASCIICYDRRVFTLLWCVICSRTASGSTGADHGI